MGFGIDGFGRKTRLCHSVAALKSTGKPSDASMV